MKIKLQNYKNFLDLGSGDGKVVLIASLFGVHACGIEHDKKLLKVGKKIQNTLKLKATFLNEDFFKQDISKYDIIFINPDTGFENGVEEKCLKEMNKKTKLFVYNNIFKPRFLKQGKTHWVNEIPITCYTHKKLF